MSLPPNAPAGSRQPVAHALIFLQGFPLNRSNAKLPLAKLLPLLSSTFQESTNAQRAEIWSRLPECRQLKFFRVQSMSSRRRAP